MTIVKLRSELKQDVGKRTATTTRRAGGTDNGAMVIPGKKELYVACATVFVAAFAFLVWMRYAAVSETVNAYARCTENCVDWRLPAYDAANAAICLALLGLAHLGLRRLRPFLAALGVLLLGIYAADLFIYLLLHHRLNLQDVLRYAGQVRMNSTVALPQLLSLQGASVLVALVAGCASLVVLLMRAPRNLRRGLTLLVIAPLVASARLLPEDSGLVSSDIYEDVLTYNAPNGVDAPYPASFVEQIDKTPALKTVSCTPPSGRARPVILLVVESLSMYQSSYLSGLHDYVPELDSIAKRYGHLQHYYANGFTTDGGLIALLTGNVPLPGVNRYASTDAYLGYDAARYNALGQLKAAGIPTAYFRSADQSFLATGDWLRKIGFEQVEGPEHPFYQGLPRGSFDEPGDRALYARFLQWFDHERRDGAFFSVVQTTTTHPPFVVPETGESGEEAALRYTDAALGAFVRDLERRGYFRDGILFITGDHRSMTSMRVGEVQAVGPDAHARVPGILLGREFANRGTIAGKWQHTDFLPSLLHVMGLESCTDELSGRFLGEDPRPARFVLHTQGMERDQVMVVRDNDAEPLKVQLDGEKTTWVAPPEDAEAAVVIDEIHRQRAHLPETPRNFAPGILRANGWAQ